MEVGKTETGFPEEEGVDVRCLEPVSLGKERAFVDFDAIPDLLPSLDRLLSSVSLWPEATRLMPMSPRYPLSFV